MWNRVTLIKVQGCNIFVICGSITVFVPKIQAFWDDAPC